MKYKPGDTVPRSGMYSVEHHSHHLMHAATLIVDSRFPRCKECKQNVRFRLLRAIEDHRVLPFRSHAFLEEDVDEEPLADGFNSAPHCRNGPVTLHVTNFCISIGKNYRHLSKKRAPTPLSNYLSNTSFGKEFALPIKESA